MILLDTNMILRYLVAPEDEDAIRMANISRSLFERIATNLLEATVSEVVIHEVCYVLASKHHYGLDGQKIQALVAPLFDLVGLKIPPIDRRIYLRALEIVANDQKLGSADALVLARCEMKNLLLATHDKRMNRFPTVAKWQSSESKNGLS
jgi:predicted nucleic acid-binding protein